MKALGASLARELQAGSVVLLSGPLGAGKTTFVRGLLEKLGVTEPIRSPTFNLLQAFDTRPPVLHVDLYRVASHAGLGIEDYLDTYVVLIEWPDRAHGLVEDEAAWRVDIRFEPLGRSVQIIPPRRG